MGKNLNNKNIKNYFYTVSDDFKLISFNAAVKEAYPDLCEGDYCYKVFRGSDNPCYHCPMAGNSEVDCPIYFDVKNKVWRQAIFSQIDENQYSVICRPQISIDEQLFSYMDKEDKEDFLKDISSSVANEKLLKIADHALSVLLANRQLYFTIYIADIVNDVCEQVYSRGVAKKELGPMCKASDALRIMAEKFVAPDSQEVIRAFNEYETIADRVGDSEVISAEYMAINTGWTKANIIPIERDENGRVTKIIYNTREINEKKESEKKLQIGTGIIGALSDEYDTLWLVNAENGELNIIKEADSRAINRYAIDSVSSMTTYAEVSEWYIENCIHPEDRQRVRSAVSMDVILANTENDNFYPVSFKRLVYGQENYHQVCFVRTTNNNEVGKYFIMGFRNINDLIKNKKANEEVKKMAVESQAARAALMDIIDSADMGIWHIFLYEGEAPRMKVDKKMEELLGILGQNLTEEEVYEHWFSHIKLEAIPSVLASLDRLKSGIRDENTYLWNHPFHGERYVRCGGSAVYVPDKGYMIRGYHYDVTEIVNADLKKLERDNLTGLYNREAFFRYAKKFMADNPNDNFDIIMSDIKNFKLINSTYGEEAGDELLKKSANYICKTIPEGIVGRYSADRFICLFKSFKGDKNKWIKNLIEEFENISPLSEVKVKCGIYENVDKTLTMAIISDRAIQALKSVKKNYSVDFAYYNGPISQNNLKAQLFESRFKGAIKNKEFVVWYQPKFDAVSETMIGAEALVRWIGPDGKLIAPFSFLPVFEEDGLICQLDEYVFRTVCEQQHRWHDEMGTIIPISVNLSRNSMQRMDVIDRYKAIVDEHKLDPAFIPIEITESAAVENNEIKELADKFLAAGFVLHMDDLGSGHSSLNGLNQLNFETIKIDKSLIDYIGNEQGDLLLRYTIAMGKGLGLRVLAEGVEDKGQLAFLKENGCDEIQGYYFSKPLPMEEFEKLLNA